MKMRLAFRVAVFSISLTLLAVPLPPEDGDVLHLVIDSGGHTAQVSAMAFTKDDKYLVTVGLDKLVRVWDLGAAGTEGKTVRTIRGEIGTGQWGVIHAAALAPDNRFLAVGGQLVNDQALSDIGSVRLHEFSNPKDDGAVFAILTNGLSPGEPVTALSISPKNKYVAIGGYWGKVCLWSLNPLSKTSLACATMHQGQVTALAFSPDEKLLVSSSGDAGGGNNMRLSETPKLNVIAQMKGHTGPVVSLAFPSRAGSILSSSDDGTIRLWDPKKGTLVKSIRETEFGLSGDFSGNLSVDADGKRALVCSHDKSALCEVLSLPSARVVSRFGRHSGPVTATALSHNGKLAATAGGLNHEIYVWSTQTGEPQKILAGSGASIASVGFAKDGQSIAFSSDSLSTTANTAQLQRKFVFTPDGISLQNLDEGQEKYLRELHAVDGAQLRLSDDQRTLEVVRGGNVQATIRRQNGQGAYHLAYSFTPNGRFIVSGGTAGVLAIYDLQGNELRRFSGHTGNITALAVSPDSKRMVSGSQDQLIKLWNLESQTDNLVGNVFVTSKDEWIAWEPEGYYVSSIHGDKYAGWQKNNGVLAAEFIKFSAYQERYYRPKNVAEKFVSNFPPPLPPPPPALPPTLEFIQAEFDADDQLRVVAKATSKSGELRDIRLFVGGSSGVYYRTPEAVDRHEIVIEAEVRTDEFPRFGITLHKKPDGDYVLIEAVARTDDARGSVKIELPYKPPSKPSGNLAKIPVSKNLFILAIGLSKYKDARFNLKNPATEAQGLVDFYTRQAGAGLFQNVEARVLKDQDVKRSEINTQLQWLAKTPKASDVRILFLSGHGLNDRGGYYFPDYEYNEEQVLSNVSVSWFDIFQPFKDIQGKTLLIIDTCHAGASLEPVFRGRTKGLTKRQDLTDMLKIIGMDSSQSMVTIASSTSQETALDESIFFKELINGLSGAAADDPSKPKSLVDVKKLGDFLTRKVEEGTMKRQHVIVSGTEDENVQNGHFPVAMFNKP